MKAALIVGALGMAAVCVLGVAVAGSQAPQATPKPVATQKAAAAAAKPQMAEDVFKNVQVLKGIPADEFMATMGFFSASLSLNCTDCHAKAANDDWARYADDTPLKVTSRKMILMVRDLNKSSFAGVRQVTCYTCHRSNNFPKVTPSLAEQYSTPSEDPDEVVSRGQILKGAPTADQILDKYIQAVGGAQQLAGLTSFVAKGTYTGYDTSQDAVPVEVYAKAPDQRATILHAPVAEGVIKDGTTVYDGHAGWINAAHTLVPMLTLTGGNLEGARADAELSFPGVIKQAFTNWRGGFPDTSIDGHNVQVIQGNMGKSVVKLYFDKDSGLLVRQVRYTNTEVGLDPTQVDYSDYRDVAGGIKLPFKWTVTWVDGQSMFAMSTVEPNVPIDPSKFAKPRP